jgi:hypothetical protein
MKNLKLILITVIFCLSFIESSVKAAQYFTITVIDETFCVYITDPATVQLAYENYQNQNTKHISGTISAGDGGFNQPWHWHLLPDSVRLVDVSIEVCDGKPSYVESGFITGIYCPWTSKVTKIGCSTVSTTTTTTTTTTTPTTRPTTTSTIKPTPTTIRGGGGGGGGRMPLMIGVTEVLNNPIVILVALIAIVVIIYGAFKFFAMPKKHR